MTDEQETKHAFARSLSNAELGCKLTKAQHACLEKLRQMKADGGWIYNHCDNIGFQKRVLDALIARGLVEYDRGHYRAVPNVI